MDKNSRLWAVVSYVTWIGWLVSYLKRDREDTLVRCHLNQAMVLHLINSACVLLTRAGGILDRLSSIVSLFVLVLAIMGIYRAAKMSEEPLPLVGGFKLVE